MRMATIVCDHISTRKEEKNFHMKSANLLLLFLHHHFCTCLLSHIFAHNRLIIFFTACLLLLSSSLNPTDQAQQKNGFMLKYGYLRLIRLEVPKLAMKFIFSLSSFFFFLCDHIMDTPPKKKAFTGQTYFFVFNLKLCAK